MTAGFVVAASPSEGIQLSPAIGRIVADVLTDGEPRFPLGAVAPDRFDDG